ncbi:MAG TPA: S8 family serine peptidase, partial [Steroidobacteraceae bacterium]|nr:S8 family serine peptidase [Steroidobacteraceae bacterium]
MRILVARTLLPLLATFSCAGLQAAETGALAADSVDDTDNGSVSVIVKFRDAHRPGDVADAAADEDVAALAGRTGIGLAHVRSIQPGLRVVKVRAIAAPGSLGVALQRLREDPGVQYAEIDQRRHAHAVLPDDTLFDGPYSGQWYLKNAGDTPSAIDAVTAWDTIRGSTGVIVAVLDTGVRYDHPDLLAAGEGGRLLPGYDFISSAVESNDGDGRDPDPSDPGDWSSSSDSCGASGSSWHGTRVSGIIAALTNDTMGVAGILWSGWVLPVRVLGRCGGFDSDIVPAMLWAAGIPVSGMPSNPYPARVINLSLGSTGSCPAEYADAVKQLSDRGVLVVASAGNEGSVVAVPANCPGVAGIAAIRHIGTKVGFSNLGPAVALSAPGGNCVNVDPGLPCLYSIDTTTNLGTTGPAANGYTDRFADANLGTSFSAPIVTGIAGLMAAANGNLTSAQLTARLREGAKPFPAYPADPTDPPLPTCHTPTDANDVQDQCVCTADTCGAGMANARGAVAAALRPIAAITLPGRFSPGQDVVLRGGSSGAACGHALASYAWSVVAGTPPSPIVGANTDTATVKAPSSGSYTVRLTVADDAGRQDVADIVVQPTLATTAAPASAGATACPA